MTTMQGRSLLPVAFVAVAGLLAGAVTPVGAQQFDGMQLMLENLRPSGQPVIPIFDGWIPKEDGSRDLCFAYFNLNLDEELDIPIGPDNSIEPAVFDGGQPTHFHPVPPEYRRYYCAFVVNVPPDFGDQRVVWTLTVHGKTYSNPAHTTRREYLLEDLYQASEDAIAPWLRFLGPVQSDAARGRRGVTAGPASAAVGVPLTVTVSVTDEGLETPAGGEPRSFEVLWYWHQGPGGADVSFDPKAVEPVELEEGETTATTTVTFSAPGEYVLRVVALNGSFFQHCCWTTGLLNVTVTP